MWDQTKFSIHPYLPLIFCLRSCHEKGHGCEAKPQHSWRSRISKKLDVKPMKQELCVVVVLKARKMKLSLLQLKSDPDLVVSHNRWRAVASYPHHGLCLLGHGSWQMNSRQGGQWTLRFISGFTALSCSLPGPCSPYRSSNWLWKGPRESSTNQRGGHSWIVLTVVSWQPSCMFSFSNKMFSAGTRWLCLIWKTRIASVLVAKLQLSLQQRNKIHVTSSREPFGRSLFLFLLQPLDNFMVCKYAYEVQILAYDCKDLQQARCNVSSTF